MTGPASIRRWRATLRARAARRGHEARRTARGSPHRRCLLHEPLAPLLPRASSGPNQKSTTSRSSIVPGSPGGAAIHLAETWASESICRGGRDRPWGLAARARRWSSPRRSSSGPRARRAGRRSRRLIALDGAADALDHGGIHLASSSTRDESASNPRATRRSPRRRRSPSPDRASSARPEAGRQRPDREHRRERVGHDMHVGGTQVQVLVIVLVRVIVLMRRS